jgi:dihydrodipicolinate synthase/N-acetylneuraminate lyase
MESNLITTITQESTTNSEQSLEISKRAQELGLVVRYDTIEYRGETINFLSTVDGVECWAQWNNQLIDLGLNNIYYREDMCRYVDRTLDLITDFRNCPNFVGAKLEYFHNGDFRDIRLIYRGRTLKVFLVSGEVNETFLISESERILLTSGLLAET